jgi:glutathione S-transferase
LVSDVHKAWAPVFVPQRFVAHERNQDDARQAAFIQLDARYDRLNALMQDKTWSLFGRRTVADAYLYVMCSWKDKTPTPLAAFSELTAFKARLDKDAAVRLALNEEGLTRP